MSKRILFLAITMCIAASLAFGQTSYIFQMGGPNTNSTTVLGLGDNDFGRPLSTANAAQGAYRMLALPDASKFYIVSPTAVQSANSNLSIVTTIAGITGTVLNATLTPDGKYLLVLADHLYIVRTSTNTVVQVDLGFQAGGTPIDVAVSPDSQTAWVLSNINSQSTVGSFSLVTLSTSQTFANLPFPANSLALSPLGLLYVTFDAAAVDEIDPSTMTLTSSGQMNVTGGLPGRLHFVPDGSAAYAVNRNACPTANCYFLFQFTLSSHSFTGVVPDPNNPPPTFDDIFVAGGNQIFGFSSTAPVNISKLWDIKSSPLSAVPSALGSFNPGPGLPVFNILAVAVSNERPSARYLYLITQDSTRPFIRVSLADNGAAVTSLNLSNGTALSYVSIPAQVGANTFFTLNTTQAVTAGAVSAPLIAYVTDFVGRPEYNQQVCFATASNGLVISNPSQITNADGRVQTTITAPTAQGSYTVTLSIGPCGSGAIFTTFTINVGIGTVTGSSQISIVTGNGQLLRQFNSTTTTQALTVRITSSDNITPIAGASVVFAITSGPGSLDATTSSTVTDDNGIASTNFNSSTIDQGRSFQSTIINANSAYGSVNFIETTHNSVIADPLGEPRVFPVLPEGLQITIGQGQVLPNAITARTTSGKFPQAGLPIPNVGIRMAAPDIIDQSTVLSCQGSSLGDSQGLSQCNVYATCQPAGTAFPQTYNVIESVGEFAFYQLSVTVTQGVGSSLQILSGNNQSGTPSSTFTLLAKVSDGCGQSVAGIPVTWVVSQGSAFLSSVQSTSLNDGSISARVTLGQTPGPVSVTVTAATATPIVFHLTTQIAVSGISLVSGGGQTAVIGQAFSIPVTFVVRDANQNPVSGLLVNFSASNGASMNPTSATTNAQGIVQAGVTAGATAGSIVVTAAVSTFSATATLTAILPGPVITTTSFTNAASGAVGLTPCGLVTVTGPGIAPTITNVVSVGLNSFVPLPYTLGFVSINILQGANTYPAPIQAVANLNGVQQANFQAPCELTPGSATVVVTVNGASATVQGVPVLVVQPGIFTYAGPNNKPYGAVIRVVDGSYVTPSNPARRGERLWMIATGLGQATPTLITNSAGTGAQNVNLPIIVGVSDRGITPTSARYLVGSIGAYLIEFTIPLDAPTGTDQSLALAAIVNNGVDGFSDYKFGNPAFIPSVISQ